MSAWYKIDGFINKTQAEQVRAIKSMPAAEKALQLSGCGLGNKSAAERIEIIKAIPDTVTSLDLSGNDFGDLSGAKLKAAFDAIPKTVSSLNLSGNDFGLLLGEDLATAFAAIPETVTTLDLSGNDFSGLLSGKEYATAFAAIPKMVTSLNLSGNDFGFLPDEQLATAFAGIPKSVTSLALRVNSFGLLSEKDHATAFAVIPGSVTTLDLSGNFFGLLSGANLEKAIAAIHSTVSKVILRDNHLFEGKSSSQIDDLLNRLKPLEKDGRLDLSNNGEPAGARVIAPLVDMILTKGLPEEVAVEIISYTVDKAGDLKNYNNQIKSVTAAQDERRNRPVLHCLKDIIDTMKTKNSHKAGLIEKAITPLGKNSSEVESNLITAVKDSSSDLYKALNTPTNQAPLTFFGDKHAARIKTKSLQRVEALMDRLEATAASTQAPNQGM